MKTTNSTAGTAKKSAGAKQKTTTNNTKSAAPSKSAMPSKSAAPRKAAGKTASSGNGRLQSHNDLDKIFKDTLKDIYWAEKQLAKALKKLSKNATNPQLAEAFTTHQAQTEDQIRKLDQAFESIGMKAQGKKCAAMEGLLEEANEHIEEYEKGPGLDAALIVGAQKVEHYEIAAYGSLRTFADVLGYEECVSIFEEIREQESDTDELLTTIALVVNDEAVGSNEEEDDDEDGDDE